MSRTDSNAPIQLSGGEGGNASAEGDEAQTQRTPVDMEAKSQHKEETKEK